MQSEAPQASIGEASHHADLHEERAYLLQKSSTFEED